MEKVFKREISLEVEPGDEGSIRISGTLHDTRLDRPIHIMTVEAEVSLDSGRILSLRGEMPHVPREECREALRSLERLVGERIEPGFTQLVREVVGSAQGCSHLAVLVTNLGNVSVQGRGAVAVAGLGEEEARRALMRLGEAIGLPGSCVVWREDGPIMRYLKREGESGSD